jgi:phosphatidylglycerophosphate synthase
LLELATGLAPGTVAVHARADEHELMRTLMTSDAYVLATGPPPEGSAILRTDRLYDRARLGRAVRRGRDPESAVLWRLDSPTALAGAEDELLRRRTYQPLGHFWALAPARGLARALRSTRIRPNQLTATATVLVLGAAGVVAWATPSVATRVVAALALALALVLDTADGHLARLQGTASAFGRWLDANLDELGDLALHAAVGWAAFVRSGNAAWLLVGLLYASGKYLLMFGQSTWEEGRSTSVPPGPVGTDSSSVVQKLARAFGHADVRWHLWILLAALGRLEWELAAYALYYPARAAAGAWRKAGCHE